MDLATLQKVLGHANIQTTINIYGDIFDYHQKNQMYKYTEYMQKMNEKYNANTSPILIPVYNANSNIVLYCV